MHITDNPDSEENFFVSVTGEVTDNQFGLIFVRDQRRDEVAHQRKGANP